MTHGFAFVVGDDWRRWQRRGCQHTRTSAMRTISPPVAITLTICVGGCHRPGRGHRRHLGSLSLVWLSVDVRGYSECSNSGVRHQLHLVEDYQGQFDQNDLVIGAKHCGHGKSARQALFGAAELNCDVIGLELGRNLPNQL